MTQETISMRLRTTTSERLDRTTFCAALALVGGLGLLGCGFQNPDPFYRFSTATTLVRCGVSREECSIIDLSGSDRVCNTVAPGGSQFVAGDVCVEPSDPGLANPKTLCEQRFCTHDVNAPRDCTVNTAVVTTGSPRAPPRPATPLSS